jgi:MerR HTH family regulatory protein
MVQDVGYSIQIMASRCGMTAHTLRYYERVGLIQPVRRGQGGQRRYSDQDEEWLKFLKSMRATHMSTSNVGFSRTIVPPWRLGWRICKMPGRF